jgi:hypothetical protein
MTANAQTDPHPGFPGARLGAVALLAGAPVALAGYLLGYDLHAAGSTQRELELLSAHEVRLAIGRSVELAGLALLVIAVIALTDRLVRAGQGRAAVGGALAGAGVVLGGVFFTGLAQGTSALAPLADREEAARLTDRIYEQPTLANLAVLGFLVGFPLLALASRRANLMPGWRALGLGLMVLVPVAMIGGVAIVFPIAMLGLTAALAPLAYGAASDRPAPA